MSAGESEAVSNDTSFRTALALFVLTFISMLYAGCWVVNVDPHTEGFTSIWRGYPFAVPLMAILLSHELGHYFVARMHRVEVSPPFFIPMPIGLIGTFGAVIRMRGPVESRDALLDIGAAGPIAGFVVTLPILIYGIHVSPVKVIDPALHLTMEGHSLLYVGLIYALKGSIATGHDIMLSPAAFAGWAGLLVTMMNLVPIGQLDGGHVAYALFGPPQHVYARRVLHATPAVALIISGIALLEAWQAQATHADLVQAAFAGMHWLVWWFVLSMMERVNGPHPPTAPSELSTARRVLAWCTLGLFLLLFMPTWIRET